MTTHKTNYPGIDYGSGRTNINPVTGLRFGVISQHEVLQAWADSSSPDYPSAGDGECPTCDEVYNDDFGVEIECTCGATFTLEMSDYIEASSYSYTEEGYQASCGEDGDIFITRSPYFTFAQFCSPCAPGACYLMNPLSDPCESNRCYCFDHSWFESGEAPYPVYRVDAMENDGKLVEVLP